MRQHKAWQPQWLSAHAQRLLAAGVADFVLEQTGPTPQSFQHAPKADDDRTGYPAELEEDLIDDLIAGLLSR